MQSKIFRVAILLVTTCLLAACDHDYPLSWSPDGQKMAVIAEDGLRIGDLTGKLSQPILQGATHLDWLPDSTRLLVSEEQQLKSWTEARAHLSESQQKEAMSLAKYIKDQYNTVGRDVLEKDPRLNNSRLSITESAILFLQDTDRTLAQKIFQTTDPFSAPFNVVRIVNAVSPSSEPAAALWEGFNGIDDLHVAPDGQFAIVVHDNDTEKDIFDVDLVSLASPGSPTRLGQSVSKRAVWTSDSRRIVFVAGQPVENQQSLGDLASITVRGDDGKPLAKTSIDRYVHLLDGKDAQLSTLQDGRIVFSAREVQLPTTDADLSSAEGVFAYKPGDRTAHRLLSKSDCESLKSITSLQANPGDTDLAIAGGNAETLYVLNIATGAVKSLSMKPKFEPCWKDSTHVCFTLPLSKEETNGHDWEVVLKDIKSDKTETLSADWPSAAVSGFLIKEKDKK